ncbi:MAG: phage tail protein, partial [Prevotella sp.]|nr:phage tail protein [Prevotella sp.]
MKKFLKWAGVAVLVPVVLFSSLAALFYFPPFQRWAVKQASAYASDKTNMDISVGNVRLKFPLDLQLNDVVAVTRGEPRDTIANIGSIVADVQMKPLLDKKVVIDELTFEKAKINTNGFIDAARVKGDIGKLRVTNSDILLNGKDDPTVSDVNLSDVLLADAKLDIVLPDSVPEDTTSSDTPWRIFAQKARIENSEVEIRSSGVQEFRSSDISSVKIGDATIENGVFDLKKGVYEVGKVDISKSGGAFGDYKIDDVA